MRAAVVHPSTDGSRTVRVDSDYPTPVPNDDEVLIEVMCVGICGTDLEILEGYKSSAAPVVLGHEFVGRIVAFGPKFDSALKPEFKLGNRVVAEVNCLPHGCVTSRNAHERAQDPSRTALGIFGKDGALAEFITVPMENVHLVPETVSDVAAVFVEPLAAASQILEQVHIPGSHKIGVLGAGKLGWLVTAVLASCLRDVTVLSRHARTRHRVNKPSVHDTALAEIFGAKFSVLEEKDSLCFIESVYDVVVDCTGDPHGLETALRLVKPRGIVILKSTTANNTSTGANMTLAVVKEITLQGSRCGPFRVALNLLERGKIDVEQLVQDVLPLESAETGFRLAKQKGSLKIVLRVAE